MGDFLGATICILEVAIYLAIAADVDAVTNSLTTVTATPARASPKCMGHPTAMASPPPVPTAPCPDP